ASGSAVRVGPTRIALNLVIYKFEHSVTPEDIVRRFDTLSLPDVYSTIGYYLRHRDEVDGYLSELRAEEDRLYAAAKAEQDRLGIRERLEARRRNMTETG